ncbi:hypothetical protein APSETT444_007327 [Aspergillus pseudonomiae]
MDDGLEVIAKIPYPLTVPKQLTTESEIATLDFLHTKGIPVPRVYTYSSDSDNAVGTEYIIMEKASGQPLDRRWFDLTPKGRVHLVTSYVDIERKLFSIPFGSYGSIYYRHSNPPLFENPDSEPPKSLEKPSLPENYSSLSPEEQSNADELHRRRMLFYLYMVFNGRDNKAHFEALRYPLMSLRQHIVDRAGRHWSGNVIALKGALIRLTEYWEQLVNDIEKTRCPVNFSKKESEDFYRVEGDWFKATILLEHWRSLLDDPGEDGWVRHESYEAVMETNKKLKEHWLAEAEDEEDFMSVDLFWPFQDHEETE